MEEIIKQFLNISSGYGYGDGDGSGDGDGYGYGYGSGSGSGDGYGSGDGDGIKSFNNKKIVIIDRIQTILNKVRNNIAKGFIFQSDLTLTPCYVVKQNDLFAHGKTLREAQEALQEKLFEGLGIDERIDMFLTEFNDDVKYPANLFYDWHNKLTGSCKLGRDAFVKDHNIDLVNGKYTISEFICLTENSYGGDVIKAIKEKLNKSKEE